MPSASVEGAASRTVGEQLADGFEESFGIVVVHGRRGHGD